MSLFKCVTCGGVWLVNGKRPTWEELLLSKGATLSTCGGCPYKVKP